MSEQAIASTSSTSDRVIPFTYAKRHGVFVEQFGTAHPKVVLRMDAPLFAYQEAIRHTGPAAESETLPAADFERRLQAFFESQSSAQDSMEEMDDLDLFELAEAVPTETDLMEQEDDAPIIRLINAILKEAISEKASDIHIEVFETALHVRFRVDGVMREKLKPAHRLAPLLISRVKVMAKMDIAEKRLPQDGRISLKLAGREVDVRVSTTPTAYGERLVLRLLDKQTGRIGLDGAGMNRATLDKLKQLIHRPHGIVLVTGPTGSGKTTTLYAALDELNDSSRNIMTVEDPIEYTITGIGQTQVNGKVDMTFARGLRAILRQDPDVVMVGEIRDRETVEIAVQASLTGHLVLSTLHTNSAAGAITRLQDMGIEPFLLSSSLNGVLAQRLVRTLCPTCKSPYEGDAAARTLMGLKGNDPLTLYRAQGCEHCNGQGFTGRAGIYELIAVDETLRSMIHDKASQQDIQNYAHQHTTSIHMDGFAKVLQGLTTIDEVLRVVEMN